MHFFQTKIKLFILYRADNSIPFINY